MIRLVRPLLFPLALASALPAAAPAQAETYHTCKGFIETLPATISTPGTWCLQQDLSTAMTLGAAITIAANNVTVDCNGFKVGGLAAGAGTETSGIFASDRTNVAVRNCNVRGFMDGINLGGFSVAAGGYRVEDNLLDGNTRRGIYVRGYGSSVRRNSVSDTGGNTFNNAPYGISVQHDVDVIDNTIANVSATAGSNAGAWGIFTHSNTGGAIGRNHVRNVLADGSGTARGIDNYLSKRISVYGNRIGNPNTAGTALTCANTIATASVASDNHLQGYAQGMQGCFDGGHNVALVAP
ncbi:MAG TPA: hypothetical protein VGD21_06750 [Lysobacter sp.]